MKFNSYLIELFMVEIINKKPPVMGGNYIRE